jgi:hypothetical protein
VIARSWRFESSLGHQFSSNFLHKNPFFGSRAAMTAATEVECKFRIFPLHFYKNGEG